MPVVAQQYNFPRDCKQPSVCPELDCADIGSPNACCINLSNLADRTLALASDCRPSRTRHVNTLELWSPSYAASATVRPAQYSFS